MAVIWLSSYPKSGNTYARMLLHNYIYGVTENTEVIAERIPGIHGLQAKNEELSLTSNDTKLVKSHYCFSKQHPYFNHTSGFIYIIRNPRDVLLSNARYLGATSNPDKLHNFAKTFINSMGVPRWQQDNMGAWPQHVASWILHVNGLPHVFIKYEDMRSDPYNALQKFINLLGIEHDDARIKVAVDSCDISKARIQETEEKKLGRYKVYNQLPNSENFVGEGKMGQSLSFIGKDIELLYKKRFSNFINLFGYE